MRRRGFIVGAGVALSAFAGCLGEEQVALSERPPENAVEDAIRTAIGESNTVALELATARDDAESASTIEIDEAGLQEHLDGARSQLEGASGSDAAADYEAELDAARTYVGVVEGLLQGTTSLVEAATRLENLESDLQAGDYDAAGRGLDDVEPTVESARSTTSSAQSDADGIDADLLDAYGAKMDELEEGTTAVANLSIGADELTTGYDSVLTGKEHLEDGRDAIDRGEYETASAEFQTAGEGFETATGHFETARTETDGELDEQVDAALCRSDALTDAAEHFEASADAADAGKVGEARRRQEDGEAALETAENCG